MRLGQVRERVQEILQLQADNLVTFVNTEYVCEEDVDVGLRAVEVLVQICAEAEEFEDFVQIGLFVVQGRCHECLQASGCEVLDIVMRLIVPVVVAGQVDFVALNED